MSPKQITMLLAGICLLISGNWGWARYLEHTKEIKIEELKSQEKIDTLKQMNFATHQQAETFKQIVQVMASNSEMTTRALTTALSTQDAMLKAAGKIDNSVIGGVSLTRYEAKDLRATPRGQSVTRIVEEQVRVVDINTANAIQTGIVFEEIATKDQFKVTISDALIEDAARGKLFEAVEHRQPIWVKLVTREVRGEVRSVELLGVVEQPAGVARVAIEEGK